MSINTEINELKNILQGKSEVSHGELIQTISNDLRRSQETSALAKGSKHFKQQETERLVEIINSTHLWNCTIDFHSFISEGAEPTLHNQNEILRLISCHD